MKTKLLFTISVLILLNQKLYSQSNEEYKLSFKDFHSTNVLDIKLTKDKKHIITSDEDGKVLMYDAGTFDFVKTIKPSGSISVSGMQLVRNDSVLVMSQRYPTSFRPEYDSLVMKNVYSGAVHKQQFSFDFIDLDIGNYFGVIHYDESQMKYVFTLSDENFESLAVVPLEGILKPKIASVSHDFSKMSYVLVSPGTSQEIITVDLETKEQINKINIPKEEDAISLFFDRDNGDLFAITTAKDEQIIKIYNLNAGDFGNPAYTVDYYASTFDKVISQYDEKKHLIVFASDISSSGSLVIIREKNKFSHQNIRITEQMSIKGFDRDINLRYQNINMPEGATDAVVNTERKEIIFANHGFDNRIRNFSVYNYDEKKITKIFPEITSNFYASMFMPDNSRVALTTGYGEDIIGEGIKYFEKGTFYNRFHALSFKDYLETKHNIVAYYARLFENKGIAVVYGNDKNLSGHTNYYAYDFAKDQLTQITDTQLHVIHLQDYNDEKNILLLSQGFYYNQGQTESVKFELIKDNKVIPVEGDYKFGKFTNDGNYLLTINKDNLIEIRSVENQKTIFTEKLKEGSYILHSIDESAFMVSNSFRYLDMNECNKETYTFEIKNNEVSRNAIPCAVVNHINQVGENVGFIMEDFGVMVNNKNIPFTKSNFPKTISFNQDGSKFILSFKNGINTIYDTETLKPLGYMIHPDSKTHIFYDENNNFFSNINPEQFLYAVKDGQKIPLNRVEEEFFNPGKILELFGTPNENYLTALNKAIQLRENYYAENENIPYQQTQASTDIIPEKDDKSTKPDLYLLSIGISDYKDNSYSLTLPGKDAIDIAKIYGKLSEKELQDYNNKFFGTKYTLYNQDNEPLGTINHFTGIYNSTGFKYLLNTKGNIWLEDQSGKYSIWNYENKTIDSLSLPELEDSFSYSDLNEFIFVKPDDTGFYLKGKDAVFEYLFDTKKFTPVSLPFEPAKNNFRPLANNKWIHFEDKFFENKDLTITIGEFDSDKPQSNFTLKYTGEEKIRDILPDGTVKTDTIFSYSKELKAASSDGRYVFYTMGSNEIFLLDLHQKEMIPTRLPIQAENQYNYEVSADAENQRFYILETLYDSEEKRLTYYDFNGKELETVKFGLNFKNDGIVNNGKSYYYIKENEGLLSENIFNNTDEILEKSSPAAFDKVYVAYIVDENADSKTVKEKINSFFEKAAPEDQVMLFLAGHGVLNRDNNYYYAPYDMDFDEVNKYGVSFETIIKGLQKSPAQNKILLMDTCHSGKTIDLEGNSKNRVVAGEHNQGDRGSRVTLRNSPEYKVSDVISTLFEDFLSNSGVTIISASSGGDLAQEHTDWGNGALTSSYIKTLKSQMPGTLSTFFLDSESTQTPIPLNNEFIDELYKEVINLTNGKQVPDIREINKEAEIHVW